MVLNFYSLILEQPKFNPKWSLKPCVIEVDSMILNWNTSIPWSRVNVPKASWTFSVEKFKIFLVCAIFLKLSNTGSVKLLPQDIYTEKCQRSKIILLNRSQKKNTMLVHIAQKHASGLQLYTRRSCVHYMAPINSTKQNH